MAGSRTRQSAPVRPDINRDIKAMRNGVDVCVTMYGVPDMRDPRNKKMVDAILDGIDSGTLSAAEADAYYRAAAAISTAHMDEADSISYEYRADPSMVSMKAMRDLTDSGLCDGLVVKAVVSKHGPEVKDDFDSTKPGYWNHFEMNAGGGKYYNQQVMHMASGTEIVHAGSLRVLMPNAYCDDMRALTERAGEYAAVEAEKEAAAACVREQEGRQPAVDDGYAY